MKFPSPAGLYWPLMDFMAFISPLVSDYQPFKLSGLTSLPTMIAIAPSPVTLQAVPKLSIAM